jgi:hypothetical protein
LNCNAHFHARRKFEPLAQANKGRGIAKEAMRFFKEFYKIEREAKNNQLTPDQHHQLHQEKSLIPLKQRIGCSPLCARKWPYSCLCLCLGLQLNFVPVKHINWGRTKFQAASLACGSLQAQGSSVVSELLSLASYPYQNPHQEYCLI